jgi:hypothetical protein
MEGKTNIALLIANIALLILIIYTIIMVGGEIIDKINAEIIQSRIECLNGKNSSCINSTSN